MPAFWVFRLKVRMRGLEFMQLSLIDSLTPTLSRRERE
jgi:hypothetical protein